ncbi:hypothetical protein [Jeongeupia chitinilytica]|uniref:Uncharacterized protein n=1 Tax=Jeongeupia chitinilytica TaxID=1041641 RepID=A0ABQ3H3F2_9NEIS|nr:hypothetical protein [Jeongeupia chitinilytica]GHD65653.1 hypothetical protein GCM10007350_26440 [Jeongeupia chitinilytica]
MRALLFLLCVATAEAATFCPYRLPGNDKSERWVNLTVVQYVELSDTEAHLVFGGGNLGSGHDVKIPLKSRDEGQKLLRDLVDTSRRCDPSPQ